MILKSIMSTKVNYFKVKMIKTSIFSKINFIVNGKSLNIRPTASNQIKFVLKNFISC